MQCDQFSCSQVPWYCPSPYQGGGSGGVHKLGPIFTTEAVLLILGETDIQLICQGQAFVVSTFT